MRVQGTPKIPDGWEAKESTRGEGEREGLQPEEPKGGCHLKI